MLELERFKMTRLAEILGITHPCVVEQSQRLDKWIVAEQRRGEVNGKATERGNGLLSA